jgi:hypothetical protein
MSIGTESWYPKFALCRQNRGFMLTQGIAAATIVMMLGQTALAGEKPIRRLSCTVVRFYVAKYSESAAEAFARSKGATEAEIETARKCLPASTVQTASFAK